MLGSIFGKKIGMSQIFTEKGQVVPVTVIDVASWLVTQVKTSKKDGYTALQLGLLKKRYKKQPFILDWLKDKSKYFSFLREIKVEESVLEKVKVGKEIKLEDSGFEEEKRVNVTSKSKGQGFQGVVKRWGFAGGPGGHGSNFHRKPGAISFLCTEGEVIKGKKLPGQHGNRQFTTKNLKVVRLDKENGCLFVKGAVPGKKNSVVTVCKQG